MLTRREANQRAAVYGGRITWCSEYGEYRCTLDKWTRKERMQREYFTDDLDDAIGTIADMARTDA